MSKLRPPWWLVLLALPLAACATGSPAASRPTAPVEVAPEAAPAPPVVVQNESGKTICYVNISSSESGHWGPDRLSTQETVAPGQQRAWSLDSGQWDVRLKDCRHNTVFERRSVAVDSRSVILKYR